MKTTKAKSIKKPTDNTIDSTGLIQKRKGAELVDEFSPQGLWKIYQNTTDTPTKIIDLFIIYLLAITGLQLFYRIVVGNDFPLNAFVAGTFCPVGIIVLLVVLRSRGRSLRQLASFFLAALVLFITAINFAG